MNQALLIIVLAPICIVAIAIISTSIFRLFEMLHANKKLPPENRPNDTWLTGTDVSVELVKHGFRIHRRKTTPATWSNAEPARHGMWKSELDAILREAGTVNSTEDKCAIIELRFGMRVTP